MRLYQKVILGLLGLVAVSIVGVTVYGMKVYDDTNKTFNNITQSADRKTKKRETAVSIEDREPFSILLLGIDTGALGRTEQGRSDSMMVVTVGGEAMSMDSVENLLDIPIDHYVTINMQGMRDLIDAVGGIEVTNKIDFTLEGVHVPKGTITLDGKTGLAYARMRKQDPEGDIGRQKRQREVVTKIVKKVMSLDGVSNYQKILKAVEKNSKTDLTWDDMMDIATNYLPAFTTIDQEQLQGEGQMMNGVYYQLLGINQLLEMQNKLKEQLNLPTSETLSQGDEHTDGYTNYQLYDDTNYNSEENSNENPGEPSDIYDDGAGYQEDTGDYSGY